MLVCSILEVVPSKWRNWRKHPKSITLVLKREETTTTQEAEWIEVHKRKQILIKQSGKTSVKIDSVKNANKIGRRFKSTLFTSFPYKIFIGGDRNKALVSRMSKKELVGSKPVWWDIPSLPTIPATSTPPGNSRGIKGRMDVDQTNTGHVDSSNRLLSTCLGAKAIYFIDNSEAFLSRPLIGWASETGCTNNHKLFANYWGFINPEDQVYILN